MGLIETLRGPKIFDMSIFDWAMSLLAAYLVGLWFKVKNWPLFLIGWVGLGVAVHWAFGVPTMLGYYLGINDKPVRQEKPKQ